MVAHAVLYEARKTISHDLDPEWDSSGTLEAHLEGSDFHLNYNRLSDFLDELTGDSMPTYESGCGLHYGTYRDRAGQIFTDFLRSCREKFFTFLSEEEAEFLLSVCKKKNVTDVDGWDISELFEELEFFDSEMDLEIAFEQWVNHLDFKWMYKLGEPATRKSHLEREQEREKQIKRVNADRDRSKRLFESLEKMYRLKYQVDLPQTIGKPGPCLHQIKQLIHDFDEEDREVLFIYGPFSNSIRDEAHGKRLKREKPNSDQ